MKLMLGSLDHLCCLGVKFCAARDRSRCCVPEEGGR